MVLLALAVLSDGACPSRRSSGNPSVIGWFPSPPGTPPHYLCKERTAVSFDAGSGDEFASNFLAHTPPLNDQTLYIRHCINCHHKISGYLVSACPAAWANARLSVTNHGRARLTINVALKVLVWVEVAWDTPKGHLVSPKRPASLRPEERHSSVDEKGKSKGRVPFIYAPSA
jgi:hypothetical protein